MRTSFHENSGQTNGHVCLYVQWANWGMVKSDRHIRKTHSRSTKDQQPSRQPEKRLGAQGGLKLRILIIKQ